ncbi:MAG: DarT ssDNA thymidine ADP-ribosyltransferase family protein [Acidimicrobiales bacterium]
MSDRLDFRQGQLFHMTVVERLLSIVSDGRLLCDVALDGRISGAPSIGHLHMKAKRRRIPVPVPPGGVVGDYVPFYLAPRSPMLYANDMGAVGDQARGQAGIVYLVTSTWLYVCVEPHRLLA